MIGEKAAAMMLEDAKDRAFVECTEESVRSELRAWQGELGSRSQPWEWRNILVDSGWGMPQWPKQWFGRDLPVGFMRVVDEEFKRVDAITVARKGATTLPVLRYSRTVLTCCRKNSCAVV